MWCTFLNLITLSRGSNEDDHGSFGLILRTALTSDKATGIGIQSSLVANQIWTSGFLESQGTCRLAKAVATGMLHEGRKCRGSGDESGSLDQKHPSASSTKTLFKVDGGDFTLLWHPGFSPSSG